MARAGITRGRDWTTRYYLCSDDEVTWRITNTLHGELVSGKLALPQFASTKQRVLEVFVGSARGAPALLEARGSFYAFAADGLLDVHPAAEALSSIIEGSRPRRIQEHVIDIGPTVRHRRWIKEQIWRPTASMLSAVRKDLSASVASGSRRVPTLRRLPT